MTEQGFFTEADSAQVVISRNAQAKNAALLDAGLTITPAERIIFSAETGQGNEALRARLASFLPPAV